MDGLGSEYRNLELDKSSCNDKCGDLSVYVKVDSGLSSFLKRVQLRRNILSPNKGEFVASGSGGGWRLTMTTLAMSFTSSKLITPPRFTVASLATSAVAAMSRARLSGE